MTWQCNSIAQRCREVREKVLRNLESVESIGSSAAGQVITVVLTFASTAVTVVVATLLTYLTYLRIPGELLTIPYAVVVLIIVFVSVALFTWKCLLPIIERGLARIELFRGVQRATEFVKAFIEFHRKLLSKYVAKLEDCCWRLREYCCEEGLEEVCADLDELKELNRRLEELRLRP